MSLFDEVIKKSIKGKKKVAIGKELNPEDMQTMATLPSDYQEVIYQEAHATGRTPSQVKNDLLTPAVQRELSGESK